MRGAYARVAGRRKGNSAPEHVPGGLRKEHWARGLRNQGCRGTDAPLADGIRPVTPSFGPQGEEDSVGGSPQMCISPVRRGRGPDAHPRAHGVCPYSNATRGDI